MYNNHHKVIIIIDIIIIILINSNNIINNNNSNNNNHSNNNNSNNNNIYIYGRIRIYVYMYTYVYMNILGITVCSISYGTRAPSRHHVRKPPFLRGEEEAFFGPQCWPPMWEHGGRVPPSYLTVSYLHLCIYIYVCVCVSCVYNIYI